MIADTYNVPLAVTFGESLSPWYLDEYINSRKAKVDAAINTTLGTNFEKHSKFTSICIQVKKYFNDLWDEELAGKGDNKEEILAERHKKAIIGYPAEVSYFKSKIKEFLKTNNLQDETYPAWYDNLVNAIFHENWGLAGIAKWMTLKDSSSAKIIGNNIFYYIKGKPVLQEQKISLNRLEQLRKALLLKTPKKRSDEDYVEVYMHSGERIAIFGGDLVYEGQPAIAFRKYIIDKLTLEEQAVRGTIPEESIPFLKASVQCGFNCSFVGPVRCGKTTMLATMQTYEYKALEGVAIQTDPEIPFHEYYPDYPIINIIVDGEEMKDIGKKVVRLDPDYILMTEARDGYAFNLVVEMTNIGAIRCKTTMHLRDIDKFCYKMASKIQQVYGGALEYHLWNVADSYHYIYEMMCLPHNRDKKRLKGIYELRFNSDNNMIEFHQICKYDITTDSWTFKYDIGNRIAKLACEENLAAFNVFKSELERLSKMYPMDGDNVIIPFYSKLLGRGIN